MMISPMLFDVVTKALSDGYESHRQALIAGFLTFLLLMIIVIDALLNWKRTG
jgi:hypothetical protein